MCRYCACYVERNGNTNHTFSHIMLGLGKHSIHNLVRPDIQKVHEVELIISINWTCSRRSSFEAKGDHSRMVFKLLDQSSLEL